jgi:hypothetical protein
LPAYLLLLEARLESRSNDSELRLTTARMTASYATLFADIDSTGTPLAYKRLSEFVRADLWVELLEDVLEPRDDARHYRLANQIARTRAERMLQQTEVIFD